MPDHQLPSAFTEVTSGYYRSPDPRQAALAFRCLLDLFVEAGPENLERFGSLIFLFGRIAQVSGEAHAALGAVVDEHAGPLPPIARRIVDARGDATFPRVAELVVERPEHVDLLWAEFFVTGSVDVVARIASLLDDVDRVRRHLELWLGERSWFGGAKRRAKADALRALGLDVDLETRTIRSEGDLDCLSFSIAERKLPIFLHLELPPEDLTAASVKASALWSLRLNAMDHEIVATCCRAEAERPGGPARRLLGTVPVADRAPFAL
jgi:hypothetical protein